MTKIAPIDRDKAAEVQAACEEALAINPHNADAMHLLGVLKFDAGLRKEGIALVEAAIRLSANSNAYNDLGQMWAALGEDDLAERCFMRSIELDDRNSDAIHNLGLMARKRGELGIALDCFVKACEIDSTKPLYLQSLIDALVADNLHARALPFIEKLQQLYPKDVALLAKKALAQEQLGQFDGARSTYHQILELEPSHARAISGLLILPGIAADHLLDTGEQVMSKLAVGDDGVIALGHALGKAYERKRDYKRAFSCHAEANAAQLIRKGPLDRSEVAKAFAAIQSACSADTLARWAEFGSDDTRPIFVVGLPRTGTSLVEQIVASHPDCFGAGELTTFSLGVDRALGGINTAAKWPVLLDGQDARDRMVHIAESYAANLSRITPPEALHTVDKFPPNFLYIGLISSIFPHARIIHCHRDPRDVALSCFFNAFGMDYDYTLKLNDFAFYHSHYRQLMDHWHRILPGRIIDVDYAALVSDPDSQIPRLVESLGLPWADSCLNYENTQRAVSTPSFWQVRQRPYKSSIGIWENYRDQIDPVRFTL
ncbi:MAG: tetratricopeptide repeat-containing sulfotransferase family protein [Sphingorhabdus sp.]